MRAYVQEEDKWVVVVSFDRRGISWPSWGGMCIPGLPRCYGISLSAFVLHAPHGFAARSTNVPHAIGQQFMIRAKPCGLLLLLLLCCG